MLYGCNLIVILLCVDGHSTSIDGDELCSGAINQHAAGISMLSSKYSLKKVRVRTRSTTTAWFDSAPLCQITLKQGGANATHMDSPVTSVHCDSPVALEETESPSKVSFHFVWSIPDGNCKLGTIERCSLEAATREGHTVNLWLNGGDSQSTVCDGTPPNVQVRRLVPKEGSHAKKFLDNAENAKAFERLDSLHQTDFIRLAILEQEPGVYLDLDVVISSPSFMAAWTEFSTFWYDIPDVGKAIPKDFVNNAILKFDRDSEMLEAIFQDFHQRGKERMHSVANGDYGGIGPRVFSDVYASRWTQGLPVPPLFPPQSVYPSMCEGFEQPFVAVHATALCGAVPRHHTKAVPGCSRSFFESMCPKSMLETSSKTKDGANVNAMFFSPNSQEAILSNKNKQEWADLRQGASGSKMNTIHDISS